MRQPEALRLADVLERSVNNPHRYWQGEAAAELRRLHSVNQELLEALKDIASGTYDTWSEGYRAQQIAIAAIEKATGGQA